jgi:hypothetical protein
MMHQTGSAAGQASHQGDDDARATMRQASTLDPTCLRCLGPMTLRVAGCPLLPRRFLAGCPACGRTVAVNLTARELRAGKSSNDPPGRGLEALRLSRRGYLSALAHIPETSQARSPQ